MLQFEQFLQPSLNTCRIFNHLFPFLFNLFLNQIQLLLIYLPGLNQLFQIRVIALINWTLFLLINQ